MTASCQDARFSTRTFELPLLALLNVDVQVLDHAARAKNPNVVASAFPRDASGVLQEHGGWVHDAAMNRVAFDAIARVSKLAPVPYTGPISTCA